MNRALLLFLISFSGCSLFRSHVVEVSIDAPMEIVPTSTQNVNNTLSVSVRGTSKAEIPASLQLLTRLTALNEKDVVGDAVYVFPQREYRVGETYDFTISVSSPKMTDYHLSLLWGEEATKIISSVESASEVEAEKGGVASQQSYVTLTALETTPAPLECSHGTCKTGVTITGNLNNTSDDHKNKINLGVVLIDNDGKELGPEETLPLDGVVLPPHSETPFEVGVVLPDGISASDASARVRIIGSQ